MVTRIAILLLPGITGWAQVNGHRGETATLAKMQRRIDHDLAYLAHDRCGSASESWCGRSAPSGGIATRIRCPT
jgi:hypothetical protein